MIAIFTKQHYESSTDEVIEWLKYYEADFIKINGSDFYKNYSFSSEGFGFDEWENIANQVNICWFRRWQDDDYVNNLAESLDASTDNVLQLNEHLNREIVMLSRFFWQSIEGKKWLSHPSELRYSKLEVLKQAKQAGLEIPATLITASRHKLKTFKHQKKRIISKCISEIAVYWQENTSLSLKTEEITDELIQALPATFFPSLFQELIEKSYELRVFYLDGQLYPMAIFSQLDTQTQLDFRNYNQKKPNRTVPYKLPKLVEDKLLALYKNLELSTGSTDLIKTKDGRYVFLEINPIGQFGMTSTPCNYNLEKKIAEYLITHDKKETV